MRFLVTAGPTREAIDDVRFISNRSTGRMGFAVAEVLARSHDVTLVSGPVALAPLAGVEFVAIENARDMLREMLARFGDCDGVIMTAAVADYRPRRVRRGKIRKSDGMLTLQLVRNPDVLAELGRRKRHQVLIGFALETAADAIASARGKIIAKGLDAIVVNSPDTFGAVRTTGSILLPDGGAREFGPITKIALAGRLERLAVALVTKRRKEDAK